MLNTEENNETKINYIISNNNKFKYIEKIKIRSYLPFGLLPSTTEFLKNEELNEYENTIKEFNYLKIYLNIMCFIIDIIILMLIIIGMHDIISFKDYLGVFIIIQILFLLLFIHIVLVNLYCRFKFNDIFEKYQKNLGLRYCIGKGVMDFLTVYKGFKKIINV
jgi:hypothetical protein